MMGLLNTIPPALLLIVGAFALLVLPATARKVGAIALAAIAEIHAELEGADASPLDLTPSRGAA